MVAKKTTTKKPAAKTVVAKSPTTQKLLAGIKAKKSSVAVASLAGTTKRPKGDTKPEPKRFAGKTATARAIKGVDTPNEKAATPRVVKAVGKLKAVPGAVEKMLNPAPLDPAPVQVQQGKVPLHTMAKSYVRTTGAGGGKLRGETYQCTVSLTKHQRDQVVAAATFRGVSLAEMIRSCVVEHLDRHALSAS